MNVNSLINRYFADNRDATEIHDFDSESIFDVYKNIIEQLNGQPEIELTLLEGLSYCLYEILDNVITHSNKQCGTVLTCYRNDESRIRILVADDGIGIHMSLSKNNEYAGITEKEALAKCIEDSVTDGKGMGFGLYSMSRLINCAGARFEIISGNHALRLSDGKFIVDKCKDGWKGTSVYLELHADREINPCYVVDDRVDCEGQFDDIFQKDDGLNDLW